MQVLLEECPIFPNGVQCGRHIVNCSRGGILNEDDMLELLESGFLKSLGIDVFENEPEANLSCPHTGASLLRHT